MRLIGKAILNPGRLKIVFNTTDNGARIEILRIGEVGFTKDQCFALEENQIIVIATDPRMYCNS